MHDKTSPPLNAPPPPVDPERIAALIDGRLDATQRAALLAQLDASPDALEVYSDAVAALREAGDEPATTTGRAGGGALPPTRTSRPLRTYAPPIALAAVLLVAVALPFLRRTQGSTLSDPQTIASALQPTNDASAIWQKTAWSELRGPSDALSSRARGARIGARIVDLEMLVRARDTLAARVALQVATLLDGTPAGGVAASAFRTLAGRSVGGMSTDAVGEAASFAEQVAGASEVRAGAWIEAARAAAAAKDAPFFESSMRAAERTITALPDLPPAARSALAELMRLLEASPRDWASIERSLDALLREVATG